MKPVCALSIVLALLAAGASAQEVRIITRGFGPSIGECARYDKVEISFDVQSPAAANPYLPYDLEPVPGLATGVGITVDGLFLPPGRTDWSQATRPAGVLLSGNGRRHAQGRRLPGWGCPLEDPVRPDSGRQVAVADSRPGRRGLRGRPAARQVGRVRNRPVHGVGCRDSQSWLRDRSVRTIPGTSASATARTSSVWVWPAAPATSRGTPTPTSRKSPGTASTSSGSGCAPT